MMRCGLTKMTFGSYFLFQIFVIGFTRFTETASIQCPAAEKFGHGPKVPCLKPIDPNHKAKSGIEKWLTKEVFDDLFPKANLGWGPNECSTYSYESFVIATRYFPRFGNEYVTKAPNGSELVTSYTKNETNRRDIAAFFAHAIQETGENDVDLYKALPLTKARDCFYRGGFYNWFEGGPVSSLVENNGEDESDGEHCTFSGTYCNNFYNNSYFFPCNPNKDGKWYKGCYFGRGAIQISYSYNYGLFNRWLIKNNITHNNEPINILQQPNLVITKRDPPLSMLASLWFYMTPQSPKPAMHDIIIGNWVSPDPDYQGGVFGPTSLVINDECNGEDPTEPGGSGENRRIKAFRWFTQYFNVPFNTGDSKTVSCKMFNGGSGGFKFPNGPKINVSWDVDWKTSWDPSSPCQCKMHIYQGAFYAYDPKIMPSIYRDANEANKKWCEQTYQNGWDSQGCSNYTQSEKVEEWYDEVVV